jgi:HAD superfamily hydrolase (TIGR01450 family)
MKAHNNILELADKFDLFLFDAYGVFWDGSKFFDGSREAMERLMQMGKTVCVLSNAPRIAREAENNYAKKGLFRGTHYHIMITSGEATRQALIEGIINKIVPNANRVYQFGIPNEELFNGTNYQTVGDLKEANLVYLSTPQLTENEYNDLKGEFEKYLFESPKPREDSPKKWDSTAIDPFRTKIKEVLDSKLPVLNANPDYTASEGAKGKDTKNFVVRQGSIAEALRQNNAKVVEFGKPNKSIYDFTFAELGKLGINLPDKSKICMIGDTLRTDIKGANNAGISSILCVETGVTANEIAKGNNLDDLIRSENVVVDYTIRGAGFGVNNN